MKYLIALFSALIVTASAQTPSPNDLTGWLIAEPGSKESTLGAQVISVNTEENATVIELEVPVSNPAALEEVTVIGRQPEQSEEALEQIRQAEWLQAYENGNYGLRIHINKLPGFEFRLLFANDILMDN